MVAASHAQIRHAKPERYQKRVRELQADVTMPRSPSMHQPMQQQQQQQQQQSPAELAAAAERNRAALHKQQQHELARADPVQLPYSARAFVDAGYRLLDAVRAAARRSSLLLVNRLLLPPRTSLSPDRKSTRLNSSH